MWGGWSGGSLGLLVLVGIALFVWAAQEYTRYHPLDATHRLEQLGKYLMPEGMELSADKAELYFDDGPVLRLSGLGIQGADGELGVFVEQAAVRFASTQLLLLSAAPKEVEARGVTLRLVRSAEGVSIAGLNFGGKEGGNRKGVVDWLNGLGWDRVWGRLKQVKVADLNLLVRDDVQHAEWVLEDGGLVMSRYPDAGERGTMTAFVRRLYGEGDKLDNFDNVPVLVSFEHGPKAEGLEIRGRLDRADAQMVSDYFPPQFADLLRAQGQVEVGTRLLENNELEQPWITLRLRDVKVHPEAAYSKPMEFPKLVMTASYVPPVNGVSSSDVLMVRQLNVTTKSGAVVDASGTITGMQGGNPLVDVSLASDKGDIKDVLGFFPDKPRGFAKALQWLEPNIQKGSYSDLTAHYKGYPEDFPGCGENCGVLDIDAEFSDGRVRFLDELTPVEAPEGRFRWRGEAFTVTAPKGTIKSEAGTQNVKNVVVTMKDIFATTPSQLRVTGILSGPASGVMAELNKMDEITGKVPLGISGKQTGWMDILVPLPRGAKASFASSTVLVSASIADVGVKGLPQLKGLDFAGPSAVVTLDETKRLRVQTEGALGGLPMKVDWSQSIAPQEDDKMHVVAKGSVTGAWLMGHVSTTQLEVSGTVGVNVTLDEIKDDSWEFAAVADGARAQVGVPAMRFIKPTGRRLNVDAKGVYTVGERVNLEKLDVVGADLAVNGTVDWHMDDLAKSSVDLPMVTLGATDVAASMKGGDLVLRGKLLDVSGYDLFDSKVEGNPVDDKPDESLDGIYLDMDVATVRFEKGDLTDVSLDAHAVKGRWDVGKLTALVDGKNIHVVRNALPGQTGRSQMTLVIEDLGRTLDVTGIYSQLNKGRLTGDITYDSRDVGGGVLKIEDFEVKNPPVMMQIMSLLSLEQMFSGSSSTLFKTATIPVRIDGRVFYLDNASLEGPSMDVRLTGSYDRGHKEMNIDGKLAPGIPLNRLVGKIPLLGALLTGSQDGVVVADFKVKGSTSEPQVNVRPLSVITPGLLKDFWRGVTGSDTPAPVKPEVLDGRTDKAN
jgi:Protein of unknown function/AsmA-like C-terminal region